MRLCVAPIRRAIIASVVLQFPTLRGPKKQPNSARDLTRLYNAGEMNESTREQFRPRNKHLQRDKTAKTQEQRQQAQDDIDTLPVGRVVQVFSLFCEVHCDGVARLCVVRKTLNATRSTSVVVGDRVRFRLNESRSAHDKTEGVIERIEPRDTVLTRADSFKGITAHPIVANAELLVIVASVLLPRVKWGVIDRMMIAGQSGGLKPIVVLNKIDLVTQADADVMEDARSKLEHLRSLDVETFEISVDQNVNVASLRDRLAGRIAIAAGHSGVGKSSLIRALLPGSERSQHSLRVGEVSTYNEKGKHTTTSARVYPNPAGGELIDTPGVKLLGLWNVSPDSLQEFFPDVAAGTAPTWRSESYQRILDSLLESSA
jgi:ribosome biogenesis GTPase / thiamine phosphate phosphatase